MASTMTLEQITNSLRGGRIYHSHESAVTPCLIRRVESVTLLSNHEVHVSGSNSFGGKSGIYLPLAIAELLINEGTLREYDSFGRVIEAWDFSPDREAIMATIE